MKSGLIFTVLLLFVFSSATLFSQDEGPWQASPEVIERMSKARPAFNYQEDKVPAYILPDVLTTADGRKITSPREWTRKRRLEILELFRENVYGRVPGTPYERSFRLVREDKMAMEGKATLRQVDIIISTGGKSLTIHLTLFMPNNVKKPSPVFLLIDNRGLSNHDPALHYKNGFWPAEEVIGRGYGMAIFNNHDVDPDNFDDFKNGIHGLLDAKTRLPDAWGTIAAWAWGASRCMDYFYTDKDIDKKRIAVVGHSRGGKTALWAGAQDKRFTMVISNESGCGGAALARRRYGETIERITTAFPHWFCLNYRKYAGNEDSMPVDMHMLLALVAPRALYIDCADNDLWGDPKGSYLSLYHSMPVFKLLGTGSGVPEKMPPLEKQVISGVTGFHIRGGEHDLSLKDWNYFMDFTRVTWK